MASEANADPQLISQQPASPSSAADARTPVWRTQPVAAGSPATGVAAGRVLNLSVWLRVAGLVLPFAFGLRLLELFHSAPGISPWRAAVVLLAVGFFSGLLVPAWRVVLYVPVAFVIGLWVGGFLPTLHSTAHLAYLGEVDLYFPSLVLMASLPAFGAAIGTVLGIAYAARR
jgi:hypothetical protein